MPAARAASSTALKARRVVGSLISSIAQGDDAAKERVRPFLERPPHTPSSVASSGVSRSAADAPLNTTCPFCSSTARSLCASTLR